jgi:hypothetical protein
MFSECLEVHNSLKFFFDDCSVKPHHVSISCSSAYLV